MTRIIWRRAHPVRLPDRDTPVHRELLAAFVADACVKAVERKLEDMLAWESVGALETREVSP